MDIFRQWIEDDLTRVEDIAHEWVKQRNSLKDGLKGHDRRLAQEEWEGICPGLKRSFPNSHL
jgi:hypothetical protein